MKYQAKIENGVVTDVIVMDDNFINSIEGNWIDYTINDVVSVGDTYNIDEGFRSPSHSAVGFGIKPKNIGMHQLHYQTKKTYMNGTRVLYHGL